MAGLVGRGANARKGHQCFLGIKTAYIANFSHELGAEGEEFLKAKYQRCTVHFNRNVFSPHSKVKLVAKMLKAIYAQESKKAARKKLRP